MDRIGTRAGKIAGRVKELDRDCRLGRLRILEIERRVVTTPEGRLEQHRQEGVQIPRREAIVGGHLLPNVRTSHCHHWLIGGHLHPSHPTCWERARVTGGTRHPVALGSQRCDRVGLGAVEYTAAVVVLDGDGSRVDVIHVLNIEGSIVGAPEGTLEQHRHEGVGRPAREAIVGGDLRTDVWTTDGHDGLVRGDLDPADPTRWDRPCVTGGTRHPVALGGQGSNGIGFGAVEHTIAVVVLNGQVGGVRSVDVLDVESGVVRATEGTFEEHGYEGGVTARGEAIVGHDLGTNVGTTDRDDGMIGRDLDPADPACWKRSAVTGGGGDPIALGGQGSDGVSFGAVEHTIGVIVLDGDIGGVGAVDVLDVEGGIVGTPESTFEEHGHEGGQRARGDAVIRCDFRTYMRTSHRDQRFI